VRGSYAMVLPDKITIYQEPLERDFPDEAELVEEVRKTVLHEIAHHFGISDEELTEMGLE
jgi:predicted Zn-dependent protease with MMP-like domain